MDENNLNNKQYPNNQLPNESPASNQPAQPISPLPEQQIQPSQTVTNIQNQTQPQVMQSQPANLQYERTNQIGTPTLNNAYMDNSAPGVTLGVLGIIFGLFIPIIGVVMGIISIVKGSKKQFGNSVLTILGVVAVVISILSGIFWAYMLTGLGVDSNYSDLETHTGQFIGVENSYSYSYDYPEQFTKGDYLAPNVSFFEHVVDRDDNDNSKYVAIVALVVEEGVSGAIFEQFKNTVSSENVQNLLNSTLDLYLGTSNAKIMTPYIIYSFAAGDGIAVEFASEQSEVTVNGKYILAWDESKNALYNFIIAAQGEFWDNNFNTWNQIANSLTVN